MISVSFALRGSSWRSQAPTNGSTVVWECQIAIGGPTYYHFDFSKRPIPAAGGAALTASIISTLGSAIVQEVMIVGHTNVPIASFA